VFPDTQIIPIIVFTATSKPTVVDAFLEIGGPLPDVAGHVIEAIGAA
jgi:hypothetical protein